MSSPQRVARLADLSETSGTTVELGEHKILLLRAGNEVQALQGTCPHAGAPLAEGAICNGRLICPWHKATFRTSDGALLEPPALMSLARYPVEVTADGDVLVAPEPYPYEHPGPDGDRRTIAIVGAGAAGTAAALALRERGFGGRVVLIGDEAGAPYDRTSLSKFVTAGQMPPDKAPPLVEDGTFETQDIQRLHARAERVDTARRRIQLSDGQAMAYDLALLATGGTPRRLDIPGADLPGVHVLRRREDAAALLAALHPGARVVILGTSFIGLEVASGLREQNYAVAMVSPDTLPLSQHLGTELATRLRDLHAEHGVRFHPGMQAERLEGGPRVERVVLKDGAVLDADLVLLGVGVRPATGFIDGLTLNEDGGVPVDPGMRASETLYAAGDIAAFTPDGAAHPVRIEHWRVAQQQARIAAHNMLGGNDRYDGVPYFWTYHYGNRFDYLGHPAAWERTVIEGDLQALRFVALLIDQDRVVGAAGCQRERATAALAERMRAPLTLDEALAVVRAEA